MGLVYYYTGADGFLFQKKEVVLSNQEKLKISIHGTTLIKQSEGTANVLSLVMAGSYSLRLVIRPIRL
jgi:hypothetical protein